MSLASDKLKALLKLRPLPALPEREAQAKAEMEALLGGVANTDQGRGPE